MPQTLERAESHGRFHPVKHAGASDTRTPGVRQALLARLGADAGEPLLIGGIPATELVSRFGSPLYAYDAAILREQLALVQNALGPRIRVLHCMKANPNVAVAGVLRHAGAGGEVASAGEIHVALAAGHRGADLHFAGPGKTREDLSLACEVGLGMLNLESVPEYEALATLCRESGARQAVGIRVNPAHAMAGTRMVMGGASKKFGVDADAVTALARRIVAEDVLDLQGLHVYAGTQCFDANAWLTNARALVQLANEVEREIRHPLRIANLGGGFGVRTYDSDPVLDLALVGRGVRQLIADDARQDRTYCVELGRYLVAEAGFYLASVTYVKESHGERHAILDGGMHHHAAAAGLGAVIRRSFPVVACARPGAPAEAAYTLGGPLCTPADELGVKVDLPGLQAGDVLAFLVSGAYGLTFSNTLFLSHPLPAEVLVDRKQAWLVRERGRSDDALRGQHQPGAEAS